MYVCIYIYIYIWPSPVFPPEIYWISYRDCRNMRFWPFFFGPKMGQKSTIIRVSRFVTHIPKRKVSQNLNTLMRHYPLLVYKVFPLALEPGFCSFCSSCPFYGETNWTKPAFCSFCSFCWFFWGTFSPFKNSIFKAKMNKTGFCSFCSFCWFDGGAKNEQNPRFVHFVHFVHSFGEHSPYKKGIISEKWLKPGFCSFLAPPSNQQKGQNEQNPGFSHFSEIIPFYRGNVPQKNEQNEQNPCFVHFCSPHQINKTNKMNKTRVSALSPLPPPPQKGGGRGQFKPQQNKQNEQNPGFSPLPSNPPPKGGGGVNLNP